MRHFTSNGTEQQRQTGHYTHPYFILKATSMDSDCGRLPTARVLRNRVGKSRSNQFWSTPNSSRAYTRHAETRNLGVLISIAVETLRW